MDTLIKYVGALTILYFILNWIADNPSVINSARTTVNTTVSEITNSADH